jgi:hypothetical protein
MIGMLQQEQQSHIASCGGAQQAPVTGSSMVNVISVEDALAQLQLELQMVQTRLRSDTTSVAGHNFEYYEDTFTWVVAHYSTDNLQYVMDMPALYSLVRPDGSVYDTFLEEESNASKAGCASCAQARLAFSFKTKFQGIFGEEKFPRNGHTFADVDVYSKWVSKDMQRRFRDHI